MRVNSALYRAQGKTKTTKGNNNDNQVIRYKETEIR